MERVDKETPGSFLGKVTQPLEKALFWIRRESKPGDPFNLPWLKWMPERIRLLLGSLASPAMIGTLPRPSIGKGIDPRMGSDSRKDKGLRPQPEKPKGKKRDPLVQGVPLSPGDKMVAFGREGSRIPPVTFGFYPSSIRNRVPLKKGHDSGPDRVMRSQSQRRRSKPPDQFLIETSPIHRVYEKHLFSLALMESLSRAQIHIPSSRKMQISDIASSPRRTGYGADERDYFFRKQDLHPEIESLKKSVAMTQKVLEERERRPNPLHELDIMGHINIHHLADQVYRSMERRITVDRERRGIY